MKPAKSSLRGAPVKLTEFSKAVIVWTKKVPRGKVATYSQIARLAGKPHAARGVGWILNSCAESHKLPWQRVINSKGKISFSPKTDAFKLQKKLLTNEGVKFLDAGAVDLDKYQWKKEPSQRRAPRTPKMFG